jgi:hypothetical protein
MARQNHGNESNQRNPGQDTSLRRDPQEQQPRSDGPDAPRASVASPMDMATAPWSGVHLAESPRHAAAEPRQLSSRDLPAGALQTGVRVAWLRSGRGRRLGHSGIVGGRWALHCLPVHADGRLLEDLRPRRRSKPPTRQNFFSSCAFTCG